MLASAGALKGEGGGERRVLLASATLMIWGSFLSLLFLGGLTFFPPSADLHVMATGIGTVFARPARRCCGVSCFILCMLGLLVFSDLVIYAQIPPAAIVPLCIIPYVVQLYEAKSLLSRLGLFAVDMTLTWVYTTREVCAL